MFLQRLEILQNIVARAGLDAVALIPGADLRFVTGVDFHLLKRPFVALFPSQGEPVFVLPELDKLNLQAANPFPLYALGYTDTDGPDAAFAEAGRILDLGGKRVGVQGTRMRFFEAQYLVRHLPGIALVDADDALADLRMRKDAAAIESMRRAIAISEAALAGIVAGVRPGMTERAIANDLHIAMLRGGGGALPFDVTVLSGPNSALPHGVPGDRPIREGELLLFDYGTTVDGYASDITRTFVVGELTDPRLRDAYLAVLNANEAGRKTAGPGVPAQEVDRAARREIVRAGFGDYFIHRTGHGLGLDVHEGPYIREGNDRMLEPGNTFTVEPGVYLPGVGGVRIEDNVLITENGAETLTTFPRELQSIGR